MTGLRQRCAVFVDWSIEIEAVDIVNRDVGYVTAKLFGQIMDKFDRHRS